MPATKSESSATTLVGRARPRSGVRWEPLSQIWHIRVRGWLPLVVAMAAAMVALVVAARTQAPVTPPTTVLAAFFWHDAPNDEAAFEGIDRGLRAGGVVPDWFVRRAGSDRARAAAQLAEIAAARPRLVFALGTQATLLAREHLRGVPVVFTAVTNPVESGIAAGWESAGEGLCGNSNWIAPEKIAEAFRLAVPGLSRLGIVRSTASGVVSAAELRQMQRHLREPGAPQLELLAAVVERADELPAAVARLRKQGVQAVWVPIDHLVYENMALLRAGLRGSGVPMVSSSLRGARAGATAGVLVDYAMLGERAAAMACAVLAGKARPDAIPVGTMQSWHLVVNLAAARESGYEVPLGALLVADRILDRIEEDSR